MDYNRNSVQIFLCQVSSNRCPMFVIKVQPPAERGGNRRMRVLGAPDKGTECSEKWRAGRHPRLGSNKKPERTANDKSADTLINPAGNALLSLICHSARQGGDGGIYGLKP